MFGEMIVSQRNHVKLLGYTLARGSIDGTDCIWYDLGEVSFRSEYFETGPIVSFSVAAMVILIMSVLVCCGIVGLLLAAIVLLYGCDVWFKLFMV